MDVTEIITFDYMRARESLAHNADILAEEMTSLADRARRGKTINGAGEVQMLAVTINVLVGKVCALRDALDCLEKAK